MRINRLEVGEVLCYGKKRRHPGTIRRFYDEWRKARGIPPRCDNPECPFYSSPLEWNKKELPLILDHKSGNAFDNSPSNLRYLCPNCDSQLLTRGGANKGRIQGRTENSYRRISRTGTTDYYYFGNIPVKVIPHSKT
jgi:hypothetical protein